MKLSMEDIKSCVYRYENSEEYKDGVEVLKAFLESEKPDTVKQFMANNLLDGIIYIDRPRRSNHKMAKDMTDDAFDHDGLETDVNKIKHQWACSKLFYEEEAFVYLDKISEYRKEVEEYREKMEEVSNVMLDKISKVMEETNNEVLKERKQIKKKYYNTIKEMVK